MPTKVMSVDAQEVMRAGIQMICHSNDDLEYAGESQDFDSSYSVARRVSPDVIVFDPRNDLPASSNFIERVHSIVPAARLLAFTRSGENVRLAIKDMAQAVCGFVTREAGLKEISMAIRSVAQGKIFICHSPSAVPPPNRSPSNGTPANRSTRGPHGAGRSMVNGAANPSPSLSNFPIPSQLVGRERDVLVRMGQGKTNQEVAKELFLSVHTIANYRQFLMRRNGLNDDADLIRFSRQATGSLKLPQ